MYRKSVASCCPQRQHSTSPQGGSSGSSVSVEEGYGDNVSSAPQHTRLQRVYRGLFRLFGPAQQGPPPYATEAEIAEYRASMEPAANRGEPQAPKGYRFTHYTDGSGIEHRAVIRDDGAST